MTASAWTDDRIERLKTLWKEGRTAEQVAFELANGITRSAVLGKVYRMGLSAGRPASPAKPRAERSSTTGRTSTPPAVGPRTTAPPQRDRERAPEMGRASLMTIRRTDCRWPLGDPRSPAFSLCGRPAVRGSYCRAHAEIAYRPAADTPRSLERLAGLA